MFRPTTLAFVGMLALCGIAQAEGSSASVTLTGQGQVSVTPDIATIYVGVDTQEDSAAAALQENSEQAGRVIGALKDAGVASQDIQTSNFSVSPVYNNRKTLSSGAPAVDGYRVTNQVTAKLRDLDALGSLLDTLVKAGANRIGGIAFGVDDDAEARDKARAMAVADARHKAEVYAAAAGVSLGEVIAISEGGGQPVFQGYNVRARMETAAAVPVEQGQATISAQVTITWEIVTD